MVRRVHPGNTTPSRSIGTGRETRIWIDVDHDVLAANVDRLRARLPQRARLIAVVKGDAYGHSLVDVARTVLASGVDTLAVANVEEGARLRAAGIDATTHLIGPSLPHEIPELLEHRLVPALAEEGFAIDLDRAAQRHPHCGPLGRGRDGPFPVQIEVDSGLRRHGIDADHARALVARVRQLPALRLTGVYTHFAAITPDHEALAQGQAEVFADVLRTLREDGLDAEIHACNTLSSTLVPDAWFDAMRIGGGLHGLGATARRLGLEPTLTLRTRVALVRQVRAGDRVGYGGTHVCATDTTLAVLPCGYADGLSRTTWTGREVLIQGRRARIVGLVSMNQMIVDVGALPEPVWPGDEVVLLGPQGDERVRAEEQVPVGGSSYEVTTLLSAAIPRRHHAASRRNVGPHRD